MTHLTREELVRWRDVGANADRERVLAHLASCTSCRREYADVVRAPAVDQPPQRFDVQTFAARGRALAPGAAPWWRRPVIWIGAPAAAAALLAIALLVPRSPAPPDTGAVRGGDIETVAPAGDVSVVEGFRWASPFRAARFRVSVRAETGEVALAAESASEQLTLSPDQRALLRAGRYTWTVEALDSAGAVVAASLPRAFSVQGR